jgi:hypothetical protein
LRRKGDIIMEGTAGGIVLLIVAIIVFSIYFSFKSIQFIIKAINLYKDMISRQDIMIKLLDNISKCCSSQNELSGKKQLGTERCPESKKVVDNLKPNSFCEYCGFKFI